MADSKKLGKRICKYREQMGLSQEQLAINSGLSLESIRAFEDGSDYPTIGSLIRLSRSLGQRVGTFTDDQFSPDPIVVKHDERESGASSHGDKGDYEYFPLGRGKTDRHMEPMFIRVGVMEQHELSAHEGEEFIVVISGRIQFIYGKEERILEPGDSAYYNSVVPHYVGAVGGPAEIYAVLYTPQRGDRMVCVPRKEITSNERLGDLLDKCIRNHPNNDAIVYVDRELKLSWAQWGLEVDRVAKGLMAMGVQKGEKVAVWATNVPDWITLMFATAKIGAILLTINTNYQSSELDYVLKQSDMENLFLIDGVRDVDYVQTVYDLVPELKTQPRENFHSEKYPHLKRVVFLGPVKHRGMYSMNEVKSLAVQIDDDEYQARKDSVDVHDVTMMQYTSGTTGFPKGVMLTHFNIANDGYWLGANMNYGPTDRLCINVPLFHCFGCVLGVMACINHGVTMCFCEVFDPIKVMTTIETEHCTSVYGVPTMFINILNHKLFSKFDFSSLRTGIMAGSPCPISAMEEVVEKMNMREITIVYGLTEASPGMTQTTYDEPSLEKKCSSVGKKLQGVDTVILDPETYEPCPDGVIGEFCCKGYNVMKGYYKMPEETAKVIDSNGYLHSGDLGYRDSEGYFYVTGRIKDMIIRGGENIYPKEVEDFLYHCPGIKDVQVVGVPSAKYGEQPGAFIVKHPGYEDMTEQDVMDFCRGKLAWYKTPKYVAFVDDFPMNAAGKILKYELRNMAHKLWPDA